jgi:hypothetical protein
LAAARNVALSCGVGWRKASGLVSRLVGEVAADGWSSICGGWAEPIERVCEEMDVSGEKEGGAML